MKSRCNNKMDVSYADYGGRGISVCPEWNGSFEAFYQWAMEHGYQDTLSIDRIDNDGNYEPQNCRWATNDVQGNNKRTNHLLTYNGKTMTLKQWSDLTKIGYHKLKDRINRCGWSVERALTTP